MLQHASQSWFGIRRHQFSLKRVGLFMSGIVIVFGLAAQAQATTPRHDRRSLPARGHEGSGLAAAERGVRTAKED